MLQKTAYTLENGMMTIIVDSMDSVYLRMKKRSKADIGSSFVI